MKTSPDNPTANVLPVSTTEEALVGAVAASGYPLQGIIARTLSASFSVVEEWDYVDDQTQENRNLDALATLNYGDGPRFDATLGLLIECKRSRHPFVFFRRVAATPAPRFPFVAGVPRDLVWVKGASGAMEVPPAVLMGLHQEPFVVAGPPACATMTRARLDGKKVELHGDESFREIILPLVKSLRYASAIYKRDRAPSHPTMLLCVAVIDAPMILIEDPEKVDAPVLCPWVRVIRREPNPDHLSWHKSRFYAIDVVHAAFIQTFIDEHMRTFGRLFADRSKAMKAVLNNGGRVEDLNSWTWQDVKPA